jgi:hypothetical protein
MRLFAVQTNAHTEKVDMRNCCLVHRHRDLESAWESTRARAAFPRDLPAATENAKRLLTWSFSSGTMIPRSRFLPQPYFDAFVARVAMRSQPFMREVNIGSADSCVVNLCHLLGEVVQRFVGQHVNRALNWELIVLGTYARVATLSPA